MCETHNGAWYVLAVNFDLELGEKRCDLVWIEAGDVWVLGVEAFLEVLDLYG
jgi:hypothetical protein